MAKKYSQLSTILKRLLFEKNMKPIDLAREVDIPQPTIHRLVTGKSTRPYKSSLKPIADYFSITIEQLLGESSLGTDPWVNEKLLMAKKNIQSIPIIPWSKIEEYKTTQVNTEQIILTTGNHSANCFALMADDSSMEPLFVKNSILIFDPDMQPIDRSYVLVKLKEVDKPVFRQLIIDIDKHYLKALNPDLYPLMREFVLGDILIATLFESRVHYNQENHKNILEK
jgi:SOS-response transcriptional repressor LexA